MQMHLTWDKQYKYVSINEKSGEDSCAVNSRNVYIKHTSDNGQYLTKMNFLVSKGNTQNDWKADTFHFSSNHFSYAKNQPFSLQIHVNAVRIKNMYS
jgi:hypothetical protein